jgi:hypothetical protein
VNSIQLNSANCKPNTKTKIQHERVQIHKNKRPRTNIKSDLKMKIITEVLRERKNNESDNNNKNILKYLPSFFLTEMKAQ